MKAEVEARSRSHRGSFDLSFSDSAAFCTTTLSLHFSKSYAAALAEESNQLQACAGKEFLASLQTFTNGIIFSRWRLIFSKSSPPRVLVDWTWRVLVFLWVFYTGQGYFKLFTITQWHIQNICNMELQKTITKTWKSWQHRLLQI